MKNFIALLLVVAAAFLCYVKYYWTPTRRPSAELSAYVSTSHDLYSRLENGMEAVSRSEVQNLESKFRDAPARDDAERVVYQDAVIVCEAINAAIREREDYVAHLNALHTGPNSTVLATDKTFEANARRQFFDEALERRWAETARTLQGRVRMLHGGLLQAENNSSFAGRGDQQSWVDALAAYLGK